MTARWVLRRARREMARRKAGLGLLATAMAVAAGLGAAAVMGGRVGASLLPRLQQRVHVIAYLDDDLAAADSDRLLEAVRRLPGVQQARLVGADEALARLRAAAASLGSPASIGSVEPGFLPRSLEIAVRPAPDLAVRTAELAARLRRIPGLGQVDDMSEGLGRLESWVALARRLGALGLALAVLAAAAGVAVALVGWRGRRRDAEVLRLLGGKPLAITLPAVLTAAGAALLGATVGLLSADALFPRLLALLEANATLGPVEAVPTLGGPELLLALLAAGVIGGVAGHLGARPARQGT